MKINNLKNKKIFIIIGLFIIIFFVLLSTLYSLYKKHDNELFYSRTFINGINCGNLSIDESVNKLLNSFSDRNIYIYKDEKCIDKFKIKTLDLNFNIKKEINYIKENQNNYIFKDYLFKNKSYTLNLKDSVDINNIIDISQLNCMKNIIKSTSAYISYENNTFKIVPEVYGTDIDTKKLLNYILSNLTKVKDIKINLNVDNIYTEPEVKSTDINLLNKMKIYEKYLNHKITYKLGDKEIVLPNENISEWIIIENNEFLLDREKISSYVDELSQSYNTIGSTRTFKSTNRGDIQVSGGNYGYYINKEKMIDKIIEDIKKEEDSTSNLILYETTYNNKEVENTYVEIDITNQHLWMYVDGNLIVETDIVSGTKDTDRDTPSGTYYLNYKEKNAVLRGAGYASPVSYWMPFNGGIGLHDATWRYSFGGNIYVYNGSHGCVNLPLSAAKIIYENIQPKMPIIIYR